MNQDDRGVALPNMNTTPNKITKRVRKFVSTLGNVGEPQYLPFTHISDKYLTNHCLSNCEAESHFSGAPIVHGWTVWESKGSRFIEAEFHGVIKKGTRFIDITPRIDGEDRILFVEDKIRTATRLGAREWNTWTNQKSYDGNIDTTHATIMRNSHDDRLF
jgi:hypothetical protein